MKYIITYKAKRKNAKRHVETTFGGRIRYFDTIEEARKHPLMDNPHYIVEILTAQYKPIKE